MKFWFMDYENIQFYMDYIHIEYSDFSIIHFFSFNHSVMYHGSCMY